MEDVDCLYNKKFQLFSLKIFLGQRIATDHATDGSIHTVFLRIHVGKAETAGEQKILNI